MFLNHSRFGGKKACSDVRKICPTSLPLCPLPLATRCQILAYMEWSGSTTRGHVEYLVGLQIGLTLSPQLITDQPLVAQREALRSKLLSHG